MNLLKGVVPVQSHDAIVEVGPYLLESFGNPMRIDYGTGHEAAFMAFLCCFERLGLLSASDGQALVARVFAQYLTVTRKLQTVYMLEPAGSHGMPYTEIGVSTLV